jgi:hypothetical protein
MPASEDEFQPRLLRRVTTGIKRPVTRVLSNTLRPRNTDQSIQPVQRQVTLPYLTFSPTIGRNSVPTSPPHMDADVDLRGVIGRTKR